jgi:hypothetical protein
MGVGRRRLVLNALGSVAVLAVVATVAVGLPVVDRAVAADVAVPADRPYQVGAGVSLVAPAGATLDVNHTRPGPDRATAVFRLGRARLAIQVIRFGGRLPEAVQRLRERLGRAFGRPVTGAERPVLTTAGVPGVEGDYPGGYWSVHLAHGVVVEAVVEGTAGERTPFVASLANLVISP